MWGRRIFPWGRRWKLGLTLFAEGRHLSLLLEGSPVTPPSPSIHPSHPLSIHSPLLPHADLPCWITQECAPYFPSPLLLFSSSFSPCPITNSFLALPSFSSHLPTHSACFSTHPTQLSPISLFLINHPFMTPVEKLLNYHTFTMSLVRT